MDDASQPAENSDSGSERQRAREAYNEQRHRAESIESRLASTMKLASFELAGIVAAAGWIIATGLHKPWLRVALGYLGVSSSFFLFAAANILFLHRDPWGDDYSSVEARTAASPASVERYVLAAELNEEVNLRRESLLKRSNFGLALAVLWPIFLLVAYVDRFLR